MPSEYHIQPAGPSFIVIDDLGEQVGTYPTEEAAKQDIERCKREDAMYESAKLLVGIAIKAHMARFGVDREESRYWVCSAMEAV